MPANPDGVSNQGEYHGKIHASEPMTTKGVRVHLKISTQPFNSNPDQHAPGVLVGNDALPEYVTSRNAYS